MLDILQQVAMANQQYESLPARPPSGVVSPLMARSRTQSISSDRPSTIGHGLVSPPQSVSPQSAFIAASAASQIVTNDHDSHADAWYDESGMIPAGETALVSYPALHLVNNFLDQLLFNFLQLSKATTLAALRPAVTEVLKPKLAKDAINNADEELHEYLGGADEDDYVRPQGADPSRDWDLELVWKRTRLRCMVYSSLGDMEEEDEDLFMEQENLEIGADEQISDVISPAVAIFLTSVLEYMGELTLTVAGQAAYHRVRTNFEKEIKDGTRTATDIADRIVVEEGDMERVALDRTLGRLWRGWKKRIRSPSALDLGIRSFSRASYSHMRQDSNVTDAHISQHQSPAAIEESTNDFENDEVIKNAEEQARRQEPAEVPLPLSENDVNEIEVPGLAFNSDDEDDREEVEAQPQRPRSLFINSTLQIVTEGTQPDAARNLRHERSASLPVSPVSNFMTPVSEFEYDVFHAAGLGSETELQEQIPEKVVGSNEKQGVLVETPATGSKKRSSMMIANTAFGPLTKAKQAQALAIAEEQDETTTTYEKAEIMTSARVSVASSSPPSSEGSVKRSASVRSARIVDVHGPKSPQSSRSPSMDTTERVRSRSVTRGNRTSTPPIAEEAARIKSPETLPRGSPSPSAGAEIPVYGVRPSAQRAGRSSESREEVADQLAYADGTDPRYDYNSYGGVGPESNVRPNGRHIPYSQSARTLPSSRQHNLPPSTKVSVNTHFANGFIDEPIPEVPTRAPGHSSRHAARSSSLGKQSLERTRTRESDDGTHPMPLSSHAPPRPIHTSGSSGSSANGSRIKAVRTSEEHVTSHAESVARNFEELIHSNQTITYTLTPENMRDMDVCISLMSRFDIAKKPLLHVGVEASTNWEQSPRSIDSPKMSRFSRGKPDDVLTQERTRASSNAAEPMVSQSSQRMVTTATNLPIDRKSQRPEPIAVPGSSQISISKSPGLKSSGSPVVGPKSPKVPASLARDARVPADSTADFAEFIKSTGPPGENRGPPIRSVNAAGVPNSQKMSSESPPPSTNSNRHRYHAREATSDSAGESRDLIDFLRQGPPSNAPRVHRHPSSGRKPSDMDYGYPVATMSGRAIDSAIPEVRHSQTSTNATEYSGPSMQSSINSNTALLKNKGPNRPKMMDEDDMMPKRKTRRIRDPYAIDFSDEEDDDLVITPQPPPKKKEESLAEFLQNYQPPPEPPAPRAAQKVPKKKSSAPSLINRLTRSREYRDFKGTNMLKGNSQKQESRSLNSRTGTAGTSGSKNGHIPIQVNMPPGYNAYGPIETQAGQPRVTAGSPASGSGPSRRIPMKKFEPRDPTPSVGQSSTAELAAFLRDSVPPPSAMSPEEQSPAEHEPSGFSRFVRRKKPVVY